MIDEDEAGCGVRGCGHRAERIGHGVLKAEYLFSDICSLSSDIWLRVAGCGVRDKPGRWEGEKLW